MLTKTVEMFVYLGNNMTFVSEIVHDDRSFKIEIFLRSLNIIKRENLIEESLIGRFELLIKKVEDSYKEVVEEEKNMGEIPDEFLDPITFTLMEEPVILPTSNQTMDKCNIVRHLHSDPTDPFTRKPLTVDMLLPNLTLLSKIQEFKENKNKN